METDLIAEGRRFLDGSPESFYPDNRARYALAFGVLALAEQFRRIVDILEKSNEDTVPK